MKYAVVTSNAVDLWSQPKFNSERLSQILFNDYLKVKKENNGYCFVEQTDGYSGWVDKRYIFFISLIDFNKIKINGTVVTPKAVTKTAKNKPTPPFFLHYGTKLSVNFRTPNFVTVQLLNGESFRLKNATIKPIKQIMSNETTGRLIIKEANRFLGVPYLWGGVTPMGFDCSGFTRSIFDRFGFYLPRDTKDQIRVGTKITRTDIKSGDLLFFKRHVAIAVNNDEFIHASIGGSGVQINSFVENSLNYRPDLHQDFQQARRVLKCK